MTPKRCKMARCGKANLRVLADAGALLACFLVLLGGLRAQGTGGAAPVARLTVDPSRIVTPVSPTLYGLMTEEINHSFEGGLYAELIQNRTFRADWRGIEPWQLVRTGEGSGSMEVDAKTGPSMALPYSLKLTAKLAGPGSEVGVSNSAYWGIAIHPRTAYEGSFYAHLGSGDSTGPLTVRLVSDSNGAVLAETQIQVKAGAWARYEYTLIREASRRPPRTTCNLRWLMRERCGCSWRR